MTASTSLPQCENPIPWKWTPEAIVIPSAIRKAKGFGAHTTFLLFADGDEFRLVPGEFRPQGEIRMYTNEEIAQAQIDSGVTPEGIAVAREGIRERGLDPDDFRPNG